MKKVMISIKGYQESPGSEGEGYELITDGEYDYGDTATVITYYESELTGFASGMKTTFTAEERKVTLSRDGGFSGDMIFCEGQKHHFVYDTPYGSFTMGVETHGLIVALDENGGELNIEYAIDVENVVISRNTFKISVKRGN